MDEIQLLLAKSTEDLALDNFRDAYYCHLDVIERSVFELRKIKFISNVAITSPSTVSLLSITRTSVGCAQEILAKYSADIAAMNEPSPPSRKASLARHSTRIYSGQAKTVNMLTEQIQTSSDQSIPSDSPVLSRISSFSSATTLSPATSPPHPHPRPTPSIPPKPTRKPLMSPGSSSPGSFSPVLGGSENGRMPSFSNHPAHSLHSLPSNGTSISTSISTRNTTPPLPHPPPPKPPSLPSPNSRPSPSRAESPKPPLPPKPARLYRKLEEIRAAEENSLDEEDDDDDDDDEDATVIGDRLNVIYPVLHRRASSPSIAIPAPARRPGTPLSVPSSPTLSPSSVPSSLSLADRSRSFTLSHYSTLSQSNAFISVIPDGSVDPSNLAEAERISGDDEDQLDQKTYGPSDHIPMIPVTPLRTTHRTLVEKEKTLASKLSETKHKLQQKNLPSAKSEKSKEASSSDEEDALTLQDNIHKYTSMISNIMTTITKVRELLYRSASITSILEFPAYLVAYQLTLIESAIFLEIPPAALLTHSPKTPHHAITRSSDFFNYLTRMVEYSVLFPIEASSRAQCMHYWVKVAVKLHELENFQTLKAILSALGTPPVKRLKRTWGFVPRKSMHKLEALSELMSEGRNYGKYREMMNSINAGTILLSPAMVSPNSTSAPTSKLDALGSNLSSFGIRAKEAARRPMVPFLGTFIMDMTYLLAAVKKTNSAVPPISAQIPSTSSLREKHPSNSPTIQTTFSPEDDVRVQDLLMTLSAYQSGPKYSSQPPRPYIKAATKNHHHFRAPSLSSALHRTAKYRTSSVDGPIGSNINHQSSFEDEEDDITGSGIRPTQQLIFHYLLTRPWVPERMVDELSTIREPPKNKTNSGSGSRTSTSASTGSTWTNAGSMYSQLSTASAPQRGSTGSNSGDGANGSGNSSRPTSVEDE